MSYSEDNFATDYLAHRSRVLQLCQQMLGSMEDAEDACQENYMKLWAGRGRLAER
ncbi:MAG: sigma factor [Porphyromonas sp.]|nr:sigma factor [Porphyromonas sp.]